MNMNRLNGTKSGISMSSKIYFALKEYKYGQQEQLTVRNQNRSTALNGQY